MNTRINPKTDELVLAHRLPHLPLNKVFPPADCRTENIHPRFFKGAFLRVCIRMYDRSVIFSPNVSAWGTECTRMIPFAGSICKGNSELLRVGGTGADPICFSGCHHAVNGMSAEPLFRRELPFIIRNRLETNYCKDVPRHTGRRRCRGFFHKSILPAEKFLSGNSKKPEPGSRVGDIKPGDAVMHGTLW